MPTYDYVCEKCGDRFEHFQKMSSEPLTVCEKCGGHLKRLIGNGMGIIFKGSGFYCTDYRKGGSSGGAKGESKSEPAKSEAAKSEAKDSSSSSPKTGTTNAAS